MNDKYAALFEDEDDVFLGSASSKLMDIIFNANNDVVRFDLENFIRRTGAYELLLAEKYGDAFDDEVAKVMSSRRDHVEDRLRSLSMELMGEIVSKSE